MKNIRILLAVVILAGLLVLPDASQAKKPVRVRLDTSMGVIVLDLFPDKAPNTVKNFLKYVRSGFYDNTIFHRVIDGFMIQGGGFDPYMTPKPTDPPILNEADNGLENSPYTLTMARTDDPHSASSQFFINIADNDFLDFKSKTPQGWGYCVFGEVIAGKNVVDKIAAVPTTRQGMFQDVPKTPVVIKRATIQ